MLAGVVCRFSANACWGRGWDKTMSGWRKFERERGLQQAACCRAEVKKEGLVLQELRKS